MDNYRYSLTLQRWEAFLRSRFGTEVKAKVKVEAEHQAEAKVKAKVESRDSIPSSTCTSTSPSTSTSSPPQPSPLPGPESQPPPLPLPEVKPRFTSFRDMPVWQEAMVAAEQVFALTDKLPRKEDYGFTSQIRRAALSISANIAEAFGRSHTLDKVNFYYIARGSVTETQSHIEYGKRVGYLKPKSAEELSARLSSVYNDLNKVILALRRFSK